MFAHYSGIFMICLVMGAGMFAELGIAHMFDMEKFFIEVRHIQHSFGYL